MNERRLLDQRKIAIEDFISVKVQEVEDDDFNRLIAEVYLEAVDSKSLQFGIEYENIQDISTDLREPDTLVFEFKLQWMIRDEET